MSNGARWDVSEDKAVDEFVDRCVTSFAAWDLVIYLVRNPEVSVTRARLAQVLGRQQADMALALGTLVREGVAVESEDHEGVLLFAMTSDEDVRDLVRRFLSMSERREHRLEFVRRVLSHISLP